MLIDRDSEICPVRQSSCYKAAYTLWYTSQFFSTTISQSHQKSHNYYLSVTLDSLEKYPHSRADSRVNSAAFIVVTPGFIIIIVGIRRLRKCILWQRTTTSSQHVRAAKLLLTVSPPSFAAFSSWHSGAKKISLYSMVFVMDSWK